MRWRAPAPQLQERDAGFTLVELLVAIVITGIITATIGSALIVGLRTSDTTGQRLNESHDAQLLATYLIADLQSVGETGLQTSFVNSSAACAGSEAGYTSATNVLRLGWNQPRPTRVDFTSEYRRAWETASQRWVLLRKTCSSDGAADLRVVVHQLHPTIAPTVDSSQLPSVAVSVTEPSGYLYSVAGVRRTPDSAPLPRTPWACTVLSAIGEPDPVIRATVAPGPLVQDEEIVVQTGGACTTLDIAIKPNDTTSDTVRLTESPPGSGRHVTTLLRGAYTWTDGEKAFPITSGSKTVATLRLTVKQACVAGQFTALPVTARRVDAPSPSALVGDIGLTVTTSGDCLPVVVTYVPRTGATGSQPLTETSPGNWTATLAGAADSWADGAHLFRAAETGVSTTLATTTITVTPGCVITPGTATAVPSPVGRTGLGKTELEFDVRVGLSTTGTCTGLKLVFTPGADGSTFVSTALSERPPDTWSGTVSKTAGAWTSGTKSLQVRDLYDNGLGSIDLVVTN